MLHKKTRQVAFYTFFLKDILFARFGFLKMPYKYILVVSKKCNSKCKNCLIWTEKIRNELTLDEYQQIAMQSPNLKWLNLTGGEVTLRDDVVQIASTFKKNCKHLEIFNFTTNGIDPKKIVSVVSELKELDFLVFKVNVSLDGPSDTHNHLRGISSNFQMAIETFISLRQIHGIHVSFSFTVYPSNVEKFDAMILEVKEFIPTISKSDFHLNLENISTHFYGNNKLLKTTVSDKLYNSKRINLFKRFSIHSNIFSPMSRIKTLYHKLALNFINTGRSPKRCMSLLTSVYISEVGDLFPCIVWNKKIGSLRENNYNVSKIITTPLANQLKQTIKDKSCPNCWTPCEAYQSILNSPLGL